MCPVRRTIGWLGHPFCIAAAFSRVRCACAPAAYGTGTHARTHCDCPFISYDDLCRLAPHIPDYAEVGAYSQSLQAMVYNSVAASLPTLLVMSVFGDDDLSSTLQYSRSAGWPVAALLDQPRVRPLFYRPFPPPSAETFCLFRNLLRFSSVAAARCQKLSL